MRGEQKKQIYHYTMHTRIFTMFANMSIFVIIFSKVFQLKLVLLWAQLTKIYPPLPTSVQPISITKTLLIVLTKNERDPHLFTGKLLIKFQNIPRNTTQVIIRHRVKILFSVISSPITLEWQKWKIIKNERDPPLFTGKLLIKFQNILRNNTQVIIWHRVKIQFSVISSPITLERQKWKSSKIKGILLSSPVNSWRTWWNHQYTPLQLRCGGYKYNLTTFF